MTNPITPPPELVRQWMERTEYDEHTWFYESYIAEQAAQWGSDQELEACCEYLTKHGQPFTASDLRATRRPTRRPKPPSLKQQALRVARVELVEGGKNAALIIKALETLPDD